MIIIPKRFKHCTLDTYQINKSNRDAFEALKDYIANAGENYENGKCFVLCGDVGVGKTHLAWGLARHIDEHWKVRASDLEKALLNKEFSTYRIKREKVVFTDLNAILDSIKSTFNRNKDYHQITHDEARKADWLIVDEIGVQFDTDKERTMLYDIFNYRYNEMRPTILLSNLDRAGIYSKLGKRICDRIFGGAEYFYIKEGSHR